MSPVRRLNMRVSGFNGQRDAACKRAFVCVLEEGYQLVRSGRSITSGAFRGMLFSKGISLDWLLECLTRPPPPPLPLTLTPEGELPDAARSQGTQQTIVVCKAMTAVKLFMENIFRTRRASADAADRHNGARPARGPFFGLPKAPKGTGESQSVTATLTSRTGAARRLRFCAWMALNVLAQVRCRRGGAVSAFAAPLNPAALRGTRGRVTVFGDRLPRPARHAVPVPPSGAASSAVG